MSVYNEFQTLYQTAETYFLLGYSLIPVWGDTRPDLAKTPIVEWKAYQQRKPTLDEIKAWFVTLRVGGLGIITGAASNGLIVLDFDDPALYQQFVRRHHDLASTRTVQTRRGYHVYFRLPPHLRIASRKVSGLDLQSDGRYVIAPPTVIDGHAYKLTRGGMPKSLSPHDLIRIERYLDELETRKLPAGQASVLPIPDHLSYEPIPLTAGDLLGLYRFLAGQGRNNALFQVSLRARDSGWTKEDTKRLLVEVHARQSASSSQPSETMRKRLDEGVRTIESAFSRPARQIQFKQPVQLPNSVREALLQRKLTSAVRVIEGLRLRGLSAGQTFTETQARNLLKGLVGAHSIREALTAVLEDDMRLFTSSSEAKSPSGHPQASNDAARYSTHPLSQKCSEIGVSKSESNPRGRRTNCYQVPGNLELAAKLGVKASLTSDVLCEDDLKSTRATRQALARELIKRRPGQYPRRWLAGRLGISLPTLRRYHIEANVSALPTYSEVPIYWWNLEREVPPDELQLAGLFLQDERGQKYPALRAIAGKLLKQGRRVYLKRQSYNTYFYGDRPPLPVTARLEPPIQAKRLQTWLRPEPPAVIIPVTPQPTHRTPVRTTEEENSRPQPSVSSSQPVSLPAPKAQRKRLSKRRYNKPLPDNYKEWLAGRVYLLIQRLTSNTNKHLSLPNARRLVDMYDPELVKAAMGRTEHYRNLQNPAGFLITYLRCAQTTGRLALRD